MPDCDEAGHPALDEEEGMHPADAAVPVGVAENRWEERKTRRRPARTEGPEEARRHHDRANSPEVVAEEPWHLTSCFCRPKYAEVEEPPTMLNPSVAQTGDRSCC